MAVEISILSGAHQGERRVLQSTRFRAGSDPTCDLFFDPRQDPGAQGCSVTVHWMGDGWYIQSSGQKEVLLNDRPIVGLTRVRPGSVVRMSATGPAFRFSAIGQAEVSSSPVAPAPPCAGSEGSGPSGSELSSFASPVAPMQPCPVGTSHPSPAAAAPLDRPKPPPEVQRGLTGATADVRTPPVGPFDAASSPSQQMAMTNTPLRPLGDRTRLLLALGVAAVLVMLAVLVVKSFSPTVVVVPAPSESVRSGAGVAHANSRGEKPQSPEAPVKPEIPVQPEVQRPDNPPPATAVAAPSSSNTPAQALSDAVLLIELEQSGRFYPLVTCCAVRPDTALTTARYALEMERFLHEPRSGWKAWVIHPESGHKWEIDQVRIHGVLPVLAERLKDSSDKLEKLTFCDLALVKVKGQLPKTAELVSDQDLEKLRRGSDVSCCGFFHQGDEILPNERLAPQCAAGKVFGHMVGSDLPGKPVRLDIRAEINRCPYGSPVVTSDGKIVAILAYSPRLEVTQAPGRENLHYGPLVDQKLVESDIWTPIPWK